jgi:replication factor C subunit 3/5
LPKSDIISFLRNISNFENLNFNEKTLENIQKIYKSDIRSMINFMQSNQDIVNMSTDNNFNIIDNEVWETITNKLQNKEKIDTLCTYIYNISIKYKKKKKNIIKDYLNYIIRNKEMLHTSEYFCFVENIMHMEDCKNSHIVNYSLIKLSKLLKEL